MALTVRHRETERVASLKATVSFQFVHSFVISPGLNGELNGHPFPFVILMGDRPIWWGTSGTLVLREGPSGRCLYIGAECASCPWLLFIISLLSPSARVDKRLNTCHTHTHVRARTHSVGSHPKVILHYTNASQWSLTCMRDAYQLLTHKQPIKAHNTPADVYIQESLVLLSVFNVMPGITMAWRQESLASCRPKEDNNAGGFLPAAQVWISKAGGYGGQAVRAKHTRPRCSAVLNGVLESFNHRYFLGVNTTRTTR